MKRALTGIAAAAVVLGTAAPMAFAATSTGLTKAGTLPIVVNGSVLSNPYEMTGKDSGNTTAFFPVYYFNQALSKVGYTATWDGVTHTWAITAPGVDASSISIAGGVGTGNTSITVNGTVVKKINTKAAKDPAASKSAAATTYLPVFYIDEILNAIGAKGSFSGQTGLSIATAQTGASFGSVTVSGNQQGTGTEASPAVNSNGGAIDLKTVLTDENGNPLANTAVTVTLSGSADDTPVVSGNGTYVTPSANSSNDTWTATVNTDSTGSIDLSVVGTGAYTVSFQAPYSSNGTAVTSANTYIAFLSGNGIVSVGNTQPDISSVSNPSAGVTPVTFTLPLDSSSNIQADKQVTFEIPAGTEGTFTTSTGQNIGTTDSDGNKLVTVYSDSNGQATVYVNDFTAESVTVNAEVGTGAFESGSYASNSVSYQDPNAATSSLSNIAAYAFASSLSSNPGTSAPSSVTGVPNTSYAYFEAVDNNGNVLSGDSLDQTFTLSATNGATIGLQTTTGSDGALAPVTLPSAISSVSNLTLEVKGNGSGGFNWYANGIELTGTATNTEFAVTLGAGSSNPASSTLTVKSGSASATAGYTFTGSTAVNVDGFTPSISNVTGVGNTSTVSFTVEDASGNVEANKAVHVQIPNSSALKGVWITGIDGTNLTENLGTNAASVYTPIPLDLGDEAVNYTVGIPNVGTWSPSATPTVLTVYTDSKGNASITFQNGDVYYGTGEVGSLTNTVDTNSASVGSLYAFTPSAAANQGVLQFNYNASGSPSSSFTALGGSDSVSGSQVGQIILGSDSDS